MVIFFHERCILAGDRHRSMCVAWCVRVTKQSHAGLAACSVLLELLPGKRRLYSPSSRASGRGVHVVSAPNLVGLGTIKAALW